MGALKRMLEERAERILQGIDDPSEADIENAWREAIETAPGDT